MRIECVGAGSVGMLVAARLAAAGADVALVARTGDQAERIRSEGLILVEGESKRTLNVQVRAFEASDEGSLGRTDPDWVFLTVKQKHLSESLLRETRRMLGERGNLLCFQNGLGHVETIARYVPSSRIHLAVTTEGAKRLGPNRVAHTGAGTTWIGPAETAAFDTERSGVLQKLVEETMTEAGFRTFLSNQMKEIVWNKLLINAVVNPLTALLRIRNGELPATEHRRQLMRRLLDEGTGVAKANGIRPRDDLWEQLIDVCAKTSGNASSMLQDLSEGRSTEIDWINGAIIRAAAERGVRVPVHETVYGLVKSSEPAD